ncbi:YcnI family protein [Amycolatopsis nigrescens]|uniref:YcnI family copper-binding membrane protein n=1 Tax=Amycolatopsis nigrescens TaxID=381445 RepID=UPI0003697FF8|nr:YcnI family protein [Amycolatopsis nigrescens]
MPRWFRSIAVGLLSAAGVLFAGPAAFAHVSVSPEIAEPGKRVTAAFRVPNERDNTSTVELVVTMPTEHPVSSVSPKALPGWHITVEKQQLANPVSTEHGELTEAVTSVRWSGGQIPPGQFQEFPVGFSTPHGAESLVFKALQTYSDGEVVRWIDAAEPGSPEPAYPAPSLRVAATATPVVESDVDTTARVLGGAGLAVALAAAGWVAIRRTRPAGAGRRQGRAAEETIRL